MSQKCLLWCKNCENSVCYKPVFSGVEINKIKKNCINDYNMIFFNLRIKDAN